jgi:microcystin degradation protein MlrC
MMMHETNTFSPLPTPIESFARAGALSGDAAIREAEGTNTSLGGFIEVARKAGAEFTVPMAASAHPSGLVTKSAYEQMTAAIVEAVGRGCDAVLLALHGAMVAEEYDDGEGELLNRLRRIAPEVPIAVALDFHTQMTDAMVTGANVITGYRTYPHVDMADTARRAGRTLMRMLAGEVDPRMVWGNRPIMSSSLVHTPSREPMKMLMGMASAAEDSGRVLNASVFGGFPQADIPHLALSSIIVCDKRTADGEVLLNKILDTAWEKREGFLFHPEPLSVQVARARRSTADRSSWPIMATTLLRAARRTS